MNIFGTVAGFFRKCFPVNVGRSERRIRLIVGLGLAGLSFSDAVTPSQEFWLVAIGWLGILSGLIGHCPVYGLFGKDASRDESSY